MIRMAEQETCKACGGTGWLPWTTEKECPVLSETGALTGYDMKTEVTDTKCSACR